ncbi:ABC transporter permease [Mesorhizobium dulcispinae]|uniref:ABC transporter permease n=1 Tax=Mesorhizobium dulcispinae TaxID=3072316 RepID=UPI002A249D49|nr:ABC transporter permease [Mesorhizobium sp. VK23D]MDX8522809.1 ABC transporter permease [Mesorhizobium sp. VK23D]
MVDTGNTTDISPREVRLPGRRNRFRYSVRKAPLNVQLCFVIVAVYLLAVLFAGFVAPFGESELASPEAFAPWSSVHPLGTDQLGRDVLSRLIYGARNSIGIAVVTTTMSFLLGGTLGMAAALLGGWVDQVVARVIDILMAFPQLIFALMLLSVFGTSIPNLITIIAVLDSTRVFRLARALAMNVTVTDYVESAQLRGENILWIIAHEILPNIRLILVAEFGLRFCFVFLTISSLSFLGLGIQPPMADWGSMVRENASLITYGDITPLVPAAAIALITVAINFIVDWYLQVRTASNG